MMKRWFALLAVLALVAAACGSTNNDDAATTQPAPTTTQPAPTTTQPAPATTQPIPTTTQPPAEGSVADLAITEVVFGDHFVITNLGEAPVSVDGLWVCNRPSYVPLSGVIAAGESLEVAGSQLSGLPAGGGEVTLYSSNSFGDSSAILDYVGWGSGGGRATQAAEVGVWPAGETVTTDGASISAPNGGASAADWS